MHKKSWNQAFKSRESYFYIEFHTWPTNCKDVQVGKKWEKIPSKYFTENFLSLCSSKTKEKSKKEDKCGSRNLAPALESGEKWQPALDLKNTQPFMARDAIRQNSSREQVCMVLANHTPWHHACRKDNECVFLVAFIAPSSLYNWDPCLSHVRPPHCLISCSPTSLRWVLLGLCPLISPKDFCFLYFYSLYFPQFGFKVSYRKRSTWLCPSFLISYWYPVLLNTFPSPIALVNLMKTWEEVCLNKWTQIINSSQRNKCWGDIQNDKVDL